MFYENVRISIRFVWTNKKSKILPSPAIGMTSILFWFKLNYIQVYANGTVCSVLSGMDQSIGKQSAKGAHGTTVKPKFQHMLAYHIPLQEMQCDAHVNSNNNISIKLVYTR